MVDYTKLSDTELITLLQKQDHLAYTQIYKRYWGVLFNHALRLVKDEAEATDIIQELFTVLWTRSSGLNVTTSLSSYLYASVRHSVIKFFNRSKLQQQYVGSLQEFLENGKCLTDDQIREKELKSKIDAEIFMLPERMREVFLLSRQSNLSHKAIAAELNIAEGTVKKQIHNAIKILRIKLGAFLSLLELLFFIKIH